MARSNTPSKPVVVIISFLVIFGTIAAGYLAGVYVLPLVGIRPFAVIPGSPTPPSLTVNGLTGGITMPNNGIISLKAGGLTPNSPFQFVFNDSPATPSIVGGIITTPTTTTTSSVASGLAVSLQILSVGSPSGQAPPIAYVNIYLDNTVQQTNSNGVTIFQTTTGGHTVTCANTAKGGYVLISSQSPSFPITVNSGGQTVTCNYNSPSIPSNTSPLVATVTASYHGNVYSPLPSWTCNVFQNTVQSQSGTNYVSVAMNAAFQATFNDASGQNYYLGVTCNTGVVTVSSINFLNQGWVSATAPGSVTVNLAIQTGFSTLYPSLVLTASSTGTGSITYPLPGASPTGTIVYIFVYDQTTGLFSLPVDVTLTAGLTPCQLLNQQGSQIDPISQIGLYFNCGVFTLTGVDSSTVSLFTKASIALGAVIIVIAIIALMLMGRSSRQGRLGGLQPQPQVVVAR